MSLRALANSRLLGALRRASPRAARAAAITAFLVLGTQAGGGNTASQPASLLFWTRYEDATALGPPTQCSGRQCWQYFSGTDNSTGHTWRSAAREADGVERFQLFADVPVNATSVSAYMVNRVESGTGRNGSRSLYSEIKRSGCCGADPQGWGATQDPYVLEPKGAQGDMYVSYWLKFQPNLQTLMGACGSNIDYQWRAVFEWKTAGDYRLMVQIQRDRDPKSCGFVGPLYWIVAGDNNGNCDLYAAAQKKKCPAASINLWSEKNRSAEVPVGQWFKLEVFWHRSSGDDGRAWLAIDGHVIVDHHGPNTGDWNAPINRIMTSQVYTSTGYPAFQWVDDLQIWQGFPTANPDDAWYDPPYAPH